MATFAQFQDASPFPLAPWGVDVPWGYIERQLADFTKHEGLDLDPDFQRGHVWTEDQQRAFVEYMLLGGPAATTIYFACDGFNTAKRSGPVCIVDGKQRLEAIRKFMRNELAIFMNHQHRKPAVWDAGPYQEHFTAVRTGCFLSDFTDNLRMTRRETLRFCVADMNRPTMLRWYIALNAGGTPHTDAEIERVKALLEAERK